MKKIENISIDTIDTFCSVLGNEITFENKGQSDLIIPCYNIGFYENEINPNSITKAIDKCYIHFKNMTEFHMNFSLYHQLFPCEEVESMLLTGDNVSYNIYCTNENSVKREYSIEGINFRYNSFAYGTYKVKSEFLNIILLDDSNMKDYNTNDAYKNDISIRDFLLNNNIDKSILLKDL